MSITARTKVAMPGGEARSGHALRRATASSRASRASTAPRASRAPRTSWPTWASGAAFVLITLVQQRSTVVGHLTETGDFAADSLRSQHAWTQVDGVFSRWGYHHPGPLLLWLKDLSERLLTPFGLDATGAQAVGVALLATLALVALGLALSGPSGSRWVGPAVVALALVGLPDGVVLVPWGPVVGNWCAVLGVAGVAAAARGARWGVPVGAAGAVGLVHLHVLLLPLAGAVAGGLLLAVLRRGPAGAALRCRSVALASGAVVALGLAPMLVAVVQGSSPWADYVRVSSDSGTSLAAYPWSVGLRRVALSYAPGLEAAGVVVPGIAALVALAVVAASAWLALRGSTAAVRVAGAAGIVGTGFLLAVCRMDFLTPETIGRAFPVVVLAGAAAEVGTRVHRRGPALLVTSLLVACLLVANVGRPPVDVARREGALRGSGAAESALALFQRSGAPLLVIDHSTTSWQAYDGAASLAVLARRQHVGYCVAERRMPLWAEPSTVCRGSTQGALRVFFTSPDAYRAEPVR